MANDLVTTIEHSIISKRDLQLVKSTLNGNKASFARLMSLYKKRIYALGMSFFKNETDTEDFLQDVFISVYIHLESFKGNSMFSTWLIRIAYNTALNSIKRRKEYLPISDEAIIESTERTPEENEIRRVTKLAVREAMNELPAKYAVCLDMYFSYDMPYQEISDITELPLNTIKSHIFRAKKILKNKLEAL